VDPKKTRHFKSAQDAHLRVRTILHPTRTDVEKQHSATRRFLQTVSNEGPADFIVATDGRIIELTDDGLFFWNERAAPIPADLKRQLYFLMRDKKRLLARGFVYVEYVPGQPLSIQLADSALKYLTYSFKSILGLSRRLRTPHFKVNIARRWVGGEAQGPTVEGDATLLKGWFRRAGGYIP